MHKGVFAMVSLLLGERLSRQDRDSNRQASFHCGSV